MSKVLITPEFINLESPPVIRALLHHLFDHADIVDHDLSDPPGAGLSSQAVLLTDLTWNEMAFRFSRTAPAWIKRSVP